MSARRQRTVGFAAAALTAVTTLHASLLAAQTTSGSCAVVPGAVSGADVCQKARDLFGFVVPQLGIAVSSGNPVLGEGGTLGGWPKRAFSVRVSAVDGRLPRNAVPISVVGAAVGSDFGAARAPIPLPSADAAIGLFPGIPLGLTNTLGVDVLLGASYLPTVTQSSFDVTPKAGGVAFQYGVRVGALQESSFIPGLSVSYMRRKTPTVDFGYAPTTRSPSPAPQSHRTRSASWRVSASYFSVSPPASAVMRSKGRRPCGPRSTRPSSAPTSDSSSNSPSSDTRPRATLRS